MATETPETVEAEVVSEQPQALATTDANALSIVDAPLLMPVMTIERAIAVNAHLKKFIEQVMLPDVDYGPIPGTDKNKKALLEPGANKLCSYYGLRPDPTPVTVTKQWPTKEDPVGFFDFVYRVDLVHVNSGRVMGSAVASCNSMEPKYRYKKAAAQTCPACGKKAVVPQAEKFGGGFWCSQFKGGCKARYPEGSTEIDSNARELNHDLPSQVLTMEAMAIKRAYVRATRMVTQASGIFDPGPDEGAPARTRKRREEKDAGGRSGGNGDDATPPAGDFLAADLVRGVVERVGGQVFEAWLKKHGIPNVMKVPVSLRAEMDALSKDEQPKSTETPPKEAVLSMADLKVVGEEMKKTGKGRAELVAWLKERGVTDPMQTPARLKEDLTTWASKAKTAEPDRSLF